MQIRRASASAFALTLAVASACTERPSEPEAPPAPSSARQDRLVFEDPAGDGKVDALIRKLQDQQRRVPKRVDGWILLGRAFVKKARQSTDPTYYANARACAARALTLRPDYPLALDLEAMVLMNQHRFRESMALVKTVLERDPDDVLALGTLADAALELGEVKAAIEAADRMADLKPSLPAYARVAHLRWLHGDIAGAKVAYRGAMDAGRGAKDKEPLAWVLCEAAKMFLALGDVEGAQAGFQRALVTLPDYPPALVGQGRVDLAQGRFDEAADGFAKAYAQSALAETAWLWAEAATRAGRIAEAAAAEAKVRKLGAHGEGRVLAAMLGQQSQQLDVARAAIEAELKTRGDVATHDTLAVVALRQGDLSTARRAMDAALRLGTLDPAVWAHEGLLRTAEGDHEAARAALSKARAAKGALMPSLADEVERVWADVAPGSAG